MKDSPLEPGLLSIFRLFLVIQLGLTVLNVAVHVHLGEYKDWPVGVVVVGAAGTLGLLGYLSWPALLRRLGRAYLPLALALAVFLALLVQGELLQHHVDPRAYVNVENVWLMLLYLLFPLVLIAWQYDFRTVVGYSLFSGVLEGVMLHFANRAVHDLLFGDLVYQRVIFLRTIVFLVAGYVIARAMAQQRQQRQALMEANRQLSHYAATLEQLATTQERNRMARELHDTLAHTLSGLAVQLEAVHSLWPNAPPQAGAMLTAALANTRSGLAETRQAIGALRASPLEDLGLGLALRQLAEAAAGRTGAQLELETPPALDKLAPAVEQGIFRIAQEALENVVRHSEARHLMVRLTRAAGWLTLLVADDGRGFEVRQVQVAGGHFGLQGVRERVELLGGQLEIRSQPGQGATLRVRLEVEP